MQVKVIGVDRLAAQLEELSQRRIAAALATAMTRTVVAARNDVRAEAGQAFDSPRPFTVNAIVHRGATAAKLEAAVLVRPDSPVLPALQAQAFGGARQMKKFEQLGATFGLPPGKQVVPGEGAELDANGNISRQQLRDILRLGKPGAARGRGRRAGPGRYFVMPSGVYTRQAGKATPVLLFVSRTHYEPRFMFFETAQRSFAEHFPRELKRAVEETVARWLKQQQGHR